jgi:hypothetical protein
VVKKIGVTEQTYYRWKKKFGGLQIEQAIVEADLPPLNGTASRERIWGWSKPREAINATRKEGTG